MMVPSTAYECGNCGHTHHSTGGIYYALPWTADRSCPDCGSTDLSVDESYPIT